jgi:hypothetical protein
MSSKKTQKRRGDTVFSGQPEALKRHAKKLARSARDKTVSDGTKADMRRAKSDFSTGVNQATGSNARVIWRKRMRRSGDVKVHPRPHRKSLGKGH